MALIDQKSDLKKLKYANFATYSTPPIVKDINDPPTYNRFSKPITARADDLVRMSRLVTANRGKLSPSASNFLANQAIIATVKAINEVQENRRKGKEQSFKSVAGTIGSAVKGTAVDGAKTIAGLLAQTPVAGTGTHFIYAPAVGTQYLKESGQSSDSERGRLGKFLQGVAQFSGIAGGGGIDGAKAALAGATIIADSKPIEGFLPNLNIEFEDNAAGNRVDEDEESIKSTFEKSKLRAGLDKLSNTANYQKNKTRDGSFGQILNGEYLNFFGETSLLPPRVEKPDGTVQYLNGFEEEDKVNTPENILNKNKTSRLNLNAREQEKSKLDVDGKFNKDFGKVSDSDKTKTIYVKATKKGLGNPFGVGADYESDELNLFGGQGQTIDDSFLTQVIPNEISEIIPFEFQVFDPDKGGNAQYLYFRAYLDSFTDNFTGNWNGTKYIGRAEEVYNYTGFDREVSFDFKIAAMSSAELRPLYRKLNFFAGVTAPSYDTNGSFMRGVYTKVSIGDYLQAVPGFFSSINLSWDTNYPWEIGFNADGEENDVPRNPTILNVSTTFKPIHNFNPELGQSFIGSSRSVNAQ
jgi:hypothetical protein